MAWMVLVDTEKHKKRFIRITDDSNGRIYEKYFKLKVSNTKIKEQFADQVKEHRAEILRKESTLDLKNFESLIGTP